MIKCRGAQILQKYRSSLKILGARRVTRNMFHTEYPQILGCSYHASSVRIAIWLLTDATVYFVKNLFPLFLPYMFRALISPSSGVSQAVFYIQPFGSCGVYVAHLRVPVDWFVVVVSLSSSTCFIEPNGRNSLVQPSFDVTVFICLPVWRPTHGTSAPNLASIHIACQTLAAAEPL